MRTDVPRLWPPAVNRLRQRLERAWARDPVRLAALTLYYLAIIGGLAAIHGGAHVVSPPFVYQGF
ncbi:MAG TPA: hypothetical protein VKW76_00200 [Candidatus Binatia bacterium]|nr:hypothetical protein [Candidatus Binatia bacterium]